MGFPGGYTDILLPNLLINALSLLGLLKAIAGFLGLTGPTDSVEPAWPEQTLTRTGPASAALIREMLPTEQIAVGPGPGQGPCAVCLQEYEEGDEVRRMKNCQHMFHSGCVDRWIDHDKDTCPMCRTPLVPKELEDYFNDKLWANSSAGIIPDIYSDYSHVTHFL